MYRIPFVFRTCSAEAEERSDTSLAVASFTYVFFRAAFYSLIWGFQPERWLVERAAADLGPKYLPLTLTYTLSMRTRICIRSMHANIDRWACVHATSLSLSL